MTYFTKLCTFEAIGIVHILPRTCVPRSCVQLCVQIVETDVNCGCVMRIDKSVIYE